MKIYVASSWRNEIQPHVVHALRTMAHEVYDFHSPRPGNNGFSWAEIDPDWQQWTLETYRDCLSDPTAEDGFALDMDALKWCEAVVGVQPFGRSASLELGWAAGAGKLTVLLLAKGEPELMIKMCDRICIGTEEMLKALSDHQLSVLRQRI